MEQLTEELWLEKRGRYLGIIFTTKNVKTKRDYTKALERLDKKWKAICYKTGKHFDKNMY